MTAAVRAFADQYAPEGLIVFVEASDHATFDVARDLWRLRLAGWFDAAVAVLVGRTTAPGSPSLTQGEAVASVLGDRDVPVLTDVDLGHVPPQLTRVTGALADLSTGAGTADPAPAMTGSRTPGGAPRSRAPQPADGVARHVRRATPDDAHDVAELQVAAWRAAYRGLLPDEYLSSLSVAALQETWSQRLAGGGDVLLAVAGAPLGFISYGSGDPAAGEPTGQVFAFYVHPDRWGTGVGRLLHEAALLTLVDAGHRRVVLWVLDTNERARRCYEHLGWWPDGATQVEALGGVQVSVLRYVRQLPAQ